MAVKVTSEQQVLQEALQILMEHLSPAKVARFWAAWQGGSGDYLALREQLFTGETVASLSEKVQVYQRGTSKRA